MRFEIDTQQLKSAISSILNLSKKMPAEHGASLEPPMTLVRHGDEYIMVSCYEWFTASVRIDGVTCLTEASGDRLEPWDGTGKIPSKSCIGLAGAQKMSSILSKLKDKTCELDYKAGASSLTLSFGKTKNYTFDVTEPRRTAANFSLRVASDKIADLSFDELDKIAMVASSFGNIIQHQVAHPEYENLCLSSETDDGETDMHLRTCVNVRDIGLSVVDNMSGIKCETSFTALVPKETATALKGFINQLKDASGITLGAVKAGNADSPNMSKSLSITADKFSVVLTCRTLDFPFKQTTGILQQLSHPNAMVKMKASELRTVMSRISVVSDPDAVLTVAISDTGTVRFDQHKQRLRTRFTAHESIPAEIVSFDDSEADFVSNVLSDIVIKTVRFIDSDDAYIGITKLRDNAAFMSLGSSDDVFKGIMIGLSPTRV